MSYCIVSSCRLLYRIILQPTIVFYCTVSYCIISLCWFPFPCAHNSLFEGVIFCFCVNQTFNTKLLRFTLTFNQSCISDRKNKVLSNVTFICKNNKKLGQTIQHHRTQIHSLQCLFLLKSCHSANKADQLIHREEQSERCLTHSHTQGRSHTYVQLQCVISQSLSRASGGHVLQALVPLILSFYSLLPASAFCISHFLHCCISSPPITGINH